jgi:hypothetical protein
MVEVGVDAEVTAVARLVKPAAHEERVGDEALYAREILEKLDEWPRIQRIEERAHRRLKVVRIEAGLESLLIPVE